MRLQTCVDLQAELTEAARAEAESDPPVPEVDAAAIARGRRMHRGGVIWSVVGAVAIAYGGFGVGMGVWESDALLWTGAISLVFGVSAVIAGIVLAARGRRIEREGRGFRSLRQQLLQQARTRDPRSARRLELAGWIILGLGGAMLGSGLAMLFGSSLDDGAGLAGLIMTSLSPFVITVGLPMGLVGTFRRRRAERARQTEAISPGEPMLGLEAYGRSN